jgi:aconitate hydratase
MLPGIEGGLTKYIPTGEQLPIYDAAMRYEQDATPLVIIAGKEYGTGSSRDWAAKGTLLLGVRAVITESFERIHRSNLVGMGVLPLQFKEGVTRHTLALDGTELVSLQLAHLRPGMEVKATIQRASGQVDTIMLLCRIDTDNEVEYFKNGGILQYVLRKLASS